MRDKRKTQQAEKEKRRDLEGELRRLKKELNAATREITRLRRQIEKDYNYQAPEEDDVAPEAQPDNEPRKIICEKCERREVLVTTIIVRDQKKLIGTCCNCGARKAVKS